jgi:potassium efflux system protein
MFPIYRRFLGLCLIFCFTAHASPIDQQKFEYLVQQKNDFTYTINEELKALTHLPSDVGIQKKLQENEENLAIVRGKISSLHTQLQNQKSQQARLSEQLKVMQKSSSRVFINPEAEKLQNQIKADYVIGKKNLDLLEASMTLAHRYESLLMEHHHQLKIIVARAARNLALSRISSEKAKLNEMLDKLYVMGIHLQQAVRTQTDKDLLFIDEKKILLNSQAIDLVQSKLAVLELNQNWVEAEFVLQKNPSMSSLETISDTYRDGIAALENQEMMLKKQLALLTKEGSRFHSIELIKQWQVLIQEINHLIKEIGIQEQTLQEDLERHEKALTQQLSRRTHLPDLRPASWPYIFKQLMQIPIQFLNYLKNLGLRVYDNYTWQAWPYKLLLCSSILAIGLLSYLARKVLKKNISSPEPMRLTRKVYRGLLVLVLYNLPYIATLVGLWVVFYLNDIAYSNYQLLFSLMGVFIFFHFLQLMSRLVFLDKHSYISDHDLHLHHQINRLLIAGTITTSLMVFSHQYPLSLFIQDLFNRLFMVFLLMVSIAIWRSKEIIKQFVMPIVRTKRPYFKSLTFLLMVLVPLTLLTTAIIGLLGYQNLAWTLSRYQAQFLMVLAVYVLARGLLIDVLELISEWMIASLYNGWLWIEVFLKPIDKLMRLTLLILLLFTFSKLIEEYLNAPILTSLMRSSSYVLVNVPGIYITISSVIEFLAVGAVFFWLSKWTKEFCYRWLYRQVRDVGIRNSFSVFTQYTVIAIGSFITIRILGFDFTGLSLILGGLAVGMGFGLRDFASNIVGGLMLLIERPVREGDLVTIGEHEGRVAHIGIRSMRVSSWDNMEVLIPNAETFNKPFTNWTHQDSIVRTVIPIKVSREDDPQLIQRILMEVLAQTPEVLAIPPAQAFLVQIDEALISFEMRYFINVNLHTRFEVRSKVLFAISARFKAEGVRPPIPPMHIELSEQSKETLRER